MILNSAKKRFRLFSMIVFILSTILEPLAIAEERIKFTESSLKQVVQELGLNQKNQTVGEFWAKNESLLPEKAKAQFAPWFKANKNQKMPDIDLVAFKDKDGSQRFRLNFNKNGENYSMALYGETERFVTVNGVPIDYYNLVNIEPMLHVLYAHFPKARQNSSESSSTQNSKIENVKKLVRVSREQSYNGFNVLPTREAFNKLPPQARAEFVARLRLTWLAAKEVELQVMKTQPAKSADYQYENLHEYFAAAFFGELAFAASKKTAQGNVFYSSSGECIDSGYRGKWNGRSCDSIQKESESEKWKSTISKERKGAKCESVCNPLVYGFDRDRLPFCADDRKNRQTATHYRGACDSAAPISIQSKEPLVPDTEINPKELFENKEKQAEYTKKLTDPAENAFILESSQGIVSSMMIASGVEESKIKSIFSGQNTNEEDLNKLWNVANAFYADINRSLAVCADMNFSETALKAKPVTKSMDTSQQLGACRQLWRRKLAFDLGMSKICPGVKFTDSGVETGKQCKETVVVPPPPPPVTGQVGDKCGPADRMKKNEKGECVCWDGSKPQEDPERTAYFCPAKDNRPTPPAQDKGLGRGCPNGKKIPVVQDPENFDALTCTCSNTNAFPTPTKLGDYVCNAKQAMEDREMGDSCKGKGFISCNSDWLLPVVGGGALLLAIMYNRKQNKKIAENGIDTCPEGQQQCQGGVSTGNCKSPYVYNYTTKQCQLSCPPGQTPNYTAGTCDSGATTQIQCSATVTGPCYCNGNLVASYAACLAKNVACDTSLPSTVVNGVCQYTCSNGTTATAVAQCPSVKLTDEVIGTRRKIKGQK